MKKSVLLLCISLFITSFSHIYASHVMGADLTYTCLGPNQYLITLNVYRDCNGVGLNGPMDLNYSSAVCGVNSTLTLNQVGGPVDITPACLTSTDACNGGSGYGIQKYTFQGVLNLPASCGPDWVLSWTLCCRNSAITTLNNPGNDNLYIQANLNNTLPTCNSSPTFGNDPVGIVCNNYPQSFNQAASAPSGDSLSYYLMPSEDAAGTPEAYNSPYGTTNPLSTSGGTTINPVTGTLTFTPNQTQVATLKIGVNEYQNGVLVGHVERDMEVIVTNCNASAPTGQGINGTTGANAYTYNTNACSNFCFTIQTADSTNATDSLAATWVASTMPGATMTSSGGLKPLLTICWAPTQADIGTHQFVINLRSNVCPYYSSASIAYTVIVAPSADPPVTVGPNAIYLCPAIPDTTLTASSTGSVTGYTWSDGTTTHPGAVWTVNPTVTTAYTVTAVYADGCQLTNQVVVYREPAPTLFAYPPVSTICSSTDTVQINGISTNASSYAWTPATGLTCTNCLSPQSSPTATTTYTGVAYDSVGCPSDTVHITVRLNTPPPPQSCEIIYATTTGTGTGTQASPTDLANALALAQCNNAVIKLGIGTYTLDYAITNFGSYTTLEGGFDPANNWIKTSTPGATTLYRSTLNMDGTGANKRLVAFDISGAQFFRLQDLTIQTANCPALAPGDSSGYSNYAIYMKNCANYNIVRCQVEPGAATNGSAGYTAPGTGGAGAGGTGGTGGGGTNSGCNANGNPGSAGTAASTGAAGGSAGGGAGGNGCNWFGCNASASSGYGAGAGSAGSAGTNAPSTAPAAPGTTTAFFNVAGQSASGTNGTAGGGGGGGGGGQLGTSCTCSIGGNASGGNGGNGGAGGLASTGGYGGGGCFGIYLFNNGASGSIVDCNVQANAAGTGGAGGTGQPAGATTAPTPPGSSNGSCSPQCNGGTGGAGGAGGNGGNGQPGAPGVAAEIVSNGTAPAYTAGGTATMINTGINNPTGFNLVGQPTITTSNTTCTYRYDTLASALSGTWDAGTIATNEFGTGVQQITEYNDVGRKDITYSGNVYTGFVFIDLDQSTFIPSIASTAPVLNGDTFYVCQGSTANFNIVIASADSFYWNFNGAVTPSIYQGTNVQNLNNLVFNTLGVFPVVINIHTSCCGWSPYDTAYILVNPQATVTYAGPTAICPGDSANIIVTATGTGVQWAPASGISNPTGTNIYASPQFTTTYIITSTSQRGLCNADTSVTISALVPPTVTFTTVPASCGSIGSATAIPNPPGSYTYLWNTTATGYTTSTITNVPAGTYTVTVTPSGASCSVSASVAVSSNGGLQAYISKIIPPLCNGQSTGQINVEGIGGTGPYQYVWSTAATIDSITGLAAGTYTVTVTDNSALSCTSVATAVLTEPLPLSLAIMDSVGIRCGNQCTGSVRVDGQGGTGPYTFVWSAPIGPDSNHVVNMCAGYYSATVTDHNGCIALGGVNIIPAIPISITSIDSNVSCYADSNGSIHLRVTGGSDPYTYTWQPNTGNTDSMATNLKAGSYTTSVTDSRGCLDTAVNIISQPAQVTLTVMPMDTTIPPGVTIQLNSNFQPPIGNPIYTWTESTPTLSCLNCPNPSAWPPAADSLNIYTLVVNYNNNLCSDTVTVRVRVFLPDTFAIPTAFTPNGDGVNDTYYIPVSDTANLRSFHIDIFDRWGQTVFTTNNSQQGWDGTYKGEPQPEGVYVVFFTIQYGLNKSFERNVSITLLR
jgi:gliding motility-associated-like protein